MYKLLLHTLVCAFSTAFLYGQGSEKPNVLVLVIDDLNDYINLYNGHPQISTPGISSIQSNGTTFLNAYTSSPKCMPSRTSFLTGKDPEYTKIYSNEGCNPFRNAFSEETENEEVFTLPEIMKDSGEYFTYGIGKIYHCFSDYPDFDESTPEACDKQLSWNRYTWFEQGEDSTIRSYGQIHKQGIPDMQWCVIPDSLEYRMYDYQSVDTALQFISGVADGSSNTCGNPFFLMIGFRKPHSAWYIPEKYFPPYYAADFYEFPLTLPYNHPPDTFPYNGIVMPPQPEIYFGDFLALPETSLAHIVTANDSMYYGFQDVLGSYIPLPDVLPGLTEEERIAILDETLRANAVIAYIAAVQEVDAQIDRMLNTMDSLYPEILENTIVVVMSDHGYSLGEKRHWQKSTMWETDLRTPFIISDYRSPLNQTSAYTASLLDLFPTLLEMTETPAPTFADGQKYLDGKSLMPLLDLPDAIIERPTIASYIESGMGLQEASCFPMYAIRNDRWHYQEFHSNNLPGLLDCDAMNSYSESLLYDIGRNRETDPNEWNNLSINPDFDPVSRYLRQFLPEGPLYLTSTWKPFIQLDTACLTNYGSEIGVSIVLYDSSGTLTDPPVDLEYRWYSNQFADTLTTNEATILTTWVDESVFTLGEPFYVYLEIVDTSGVITGFDMITIHTTVSLTPTVDFTSSTDSLTTVYFSDILITGIYDSVVWDFGDGTTFIGENPLSHTYATQDAWVVNCTVYYSNNNDCFTSISDTLTWPPITDEIISITPALNIYPNPGSGSFQLELTPSELIASLEVWSLTGTMIYYLQQETSGGQLIETGINQAGTYFLIVTLQNGEPLYRKLMVMD